MSVLIPADDSNDPSAENSNNFPAEDSNNFPVEDLNDFPVEDSNDSLVVCQFLGAAYFVCRHLNKWNCVCVCVFVLRSSG